MLGLDLGARFLRGAICDLRGEVRARQDVEMPGADVARRLGRGGRAARPAAAPRPTCRRGALDGAVAGVPGVVESPAGAVGLAGNIPGPRGPADRRRRSSERLGVPVTVENDVNLAAIGEQWRGVAQGVEDFVFLSVGTGLGAGLVLRGELHRGHHGAAGEVDYALGGDLEQRDTTRPPPASRRSPRALAAEGGLRPRSRPPYDARAIFAAARGGRRARARAWSPRRRGGSPATSSRSRRSPTSGSSCSAAASARTATCCSARSASCSPQRCPYPPRVEVSSLGDAAVLTGALAVGLRVALDNVFTRRSRPHAPRA